MFFKEIESLVNKQQEEKSARVRAEFQRILDNGEYSSVYRIEGAMDLVAVDLPNRVYEKFAGAFFETTNTNETANAIRKAIGAYQSFHENDTVSIYFKKDQNVL
jgi:hypothetical protein